ncbi:MAG: hypothetical protein ACLP52_10180 [Streptosporangiaceae bacterium]
MSITRTQAVPLRAAGVRSWRTAVGLAALGGAAAVITGAFLPWAAAFAGLVAIPGIRGLNGKILLAAGVLIAAAGLFHLIRGDGRSRWVIGLAGFGTAAFAGYLLMRLATTLQALSGSMDLVRGGPGLWVIGAGGLAALATLFLPASDQRAFRERTSGDAGLAAWAADRVSAGPRRWLQAGLGVVWLLDAALQFQPFMFSRGFALGITEPAGMGSPAFVATPVMSYGTLIARHAVAFNAVFATVQLALAVGLLWRPTVRAALAASIVWALGVWWVGEGMGMIFSGSASPLTGAPGAALLYALIAVLAWPARPSAQEETTASSAVGRASSAVGRASSAVGRASSADRSPLGRWSRLAWLALWGSGAYLLLQPASIAAGALRATIAGLVAGEPGPVAAMDRAVASALGSGIAVPVVIAVVFAIIAVGIFVPAATRPVLVLAVVTAAVIWVLGENFGGILTGQGTDPNTGPLLILLAAAFWPVREAVRRPAGAGATAAAVQAEPVPLRPAQPGPAQG